MGQHLVADDDLTPDQRAAEEWIRNELAVTSPLATGIVKFRRRRAIRRLVTSPVWWERTQAAAQGLPVDEVADVAHRLAEHEGGAAFLMEAAANDPEADPAEYGQSVEFGWVIWLTLAAELLKLLILWWQHRQESPNATLSSGPRDGDGAGECQPQSPSAAE